MEKFARGVKRLERYIFENGLLRNISDPNQVVYLLDLYNTPPIPKGKKRNKTTNTHSLQCTK